MEIFSELVVGIQLIQERFISGLFGPGKELADFIKSGKPLEQLSDTQVFEYVCAAWR
jgi:hypothetical protein